MQQNKWERVGLKLYKDGVQLTCTEEGILTPGFEKTFLRTLSCLRSKDPKIYDKSYNFFDSCETSGCNKTVAHAEKASRPIYLNDYERDIVMKHHGKLPEDEKESNVEMDQFLQLKQTSSYEAEQQELKDNFKKIFDDSDNDEEFLIKRIKTTGEQREEEEDFIQWMKGDEINTQNKEDVADLEYLHKTWNDPLLENDEKFLRDYILGKKHVFDSLDDRIPTYDEIVKSEDEEQDFSEEERFSEKEAIFEHKYNFRFEEPDHEFIKRYPRIMIDSVRRKDEKRKVKRLQTRKRHLQIKEEQRQELKRLKSLKRKEILNKLEKIKEITGNTSVGFKCSDLEGDFDPEKYDQKMKEVFNEDFYDEAMGNGGDLDEKPEFPLLDFDEYEENWDEWQGENFSKENPNSKEWEPHCDDPDFVMDCEYDPRAKLQEQLVEFSKKKKKRQSKLALALKRQKPVFNADEQRFEEYFDEYYKLDYEDMIGDLPCRFKYRKVLPNDFGLHIEEILAADDKELNRWCSLKKTCQHRTKDEELYDVQAYKKKSNNLEKKMKVLKSVYSDQDDSMNMAVLVTPEKMQARKREQGFTIETTATNTEANKDSLKRNSNSEDPESSSVNVIAVNKHGKVEKCGNVPKRRRNRMTTRADKISRKQPLNSRSQITDSRLKAYGINPKKFRNKLKYRSNAQNM